MNGDQATMNLTAVRSIANAVLYEGYILYPYRASSQKNQSRWQWGVVMAPGYAAADPSERSSTQAECVLEHTGQPVVRVILRFLQVQRRTTEGFGQGWDEAVEREIEVTADTAALLGDGVVEEFAIAGGEDRDPLGEPGSAGPATRSAAGSRWQARSRCGRSPFTARGVRSGCRSGWRTGPWSAPCRRAGRTPCRRRWSRRTPSSAFPAGSSSR